MEALSDAQSLKTLLGIMRSMFVVVRCVEVLNEGRLRCVLLFTPVERAAEACILRTGEVAAVEPAAIRTLRILRKTSSLLTRHQAVAGCGIVCERDK